MLQFSRRLTAYFSLFVVVALALGVAYFIFTPSSGSDDDNEMSAASTSPTRSAEVAGAEPTDRAASPTVAPTETQTAQPSPISPVETPQVSPSSGPTAVNAPQVQLSPSEMGQGQWATVRLWNHTASSAMAIFLGRRYPLVADGEFFWGILASPGDQESGVYTVTVELYDADGSLLGELATEMSVVDTGYPVENIDLPPESTALLDPAIVQEEENTRAGVFAMFTPQRLWSGPFIYPVAAEIGSYYGTRRSYNGGPVSGYHHGLDLAAGEGAPIAASNGGRVAYAGPSPLRGNSVIIDHGVGVFSGYHHLSAINVQVGQMVTQGEVIGAVGSTGMVTGPHLHWEIIVRGMEVDPLLWVSEPIGF
jgi:murein DD-endopeptidase MepM/ murein hydrolase activator NlpD